MEQQFEYPGIALHDGLKNGKTGGRIILTGSSLRFMWDQGNIELPLQDLTIKKAGPSVILFSLNITPVPGGSSIPIKKAS